MSFGSTADRVVVTGAAGFLGSAVLARAVAQGVRTCGLVRAGETPPAVEGARIALAEWGSAPTLAAALRDLGPGAVIHCAGHSGRFSGRPDLETLYDANVATTWRLCEAVSSVAPAARVVVVSSASVYGPRPPVPTPEHAPLAPRTHYAASKAAAETVAGAYAADGLSVVVARPFNITGPGEAPGSVVTAIASQALAADAGGRAVVRLREAASARDFIDVDDVASALVTLATAPNATGAYNVCSGVGVTIADLVERAGVAWGREIDLKVDDPSAAGTVSVGDPTRLRALGWRNEHTLEDSLIRLAASRGGAAT